MTGRSPSGRAGRASTEPRVAPGLGHTATIPNAYRCISVLADALAQAIVKLDPVHEAGK